MRIIFAGTPAFAAAHLECLLSQPEHQLAGVYTQPDRRAGRGRKMTPSPVKQLALEHSLAVFQPPSLRDPATQTDLATLRADIMVVVAYGLILPQVILDTPRLGCINVHASLLPRWRGAAPVQRAIQAGDTTTGITIMQMDAGLDTGAILMSVPCPIVDTDNSGTLMAKLAMLGPTTLGTVLNQLEQGSAQPRTQDNSLTCYAARVEKRETLINWKYSATQVARDIRAFNPSPVSHTYLNGKRFRIWAATALSQAASGRPGEIIETGKTQMLIACGEGTLQVTRAQLPGGRALDITDLLNARRELLSPGQVLGPDD